MTTAAPADARRSGRRNAENADRPATNAPTVAPPPKMRRRPMLVVIGVAAICLGALLSLWAYSSTSDAQSVLAARETVQRGQVITADDLMTVKVGVDPALHPLPASDLDSIVGKVAALDLVSGGVITAEQVTDTAIPAEGHSVVGISLTPAMLPAGQLRVGDAVRIVSTPGTSGEVTSDTAVDSIDAEVVGISSDEVTGNAILNVQVPFDQAPDVAARAATGKVAVVLDPRAEG